jgi:hypothetical protein
MVERKGFLKNRYEQAESNAGFVKPHLSRAKLCAANALR